MQKKIHRKKYIESVAREKNSHLVSVALVEHAKNLLALRRHFRVLGQHAARTITVPFQADYRRNGDHCFRGRSNSSCGAGRKVQHTGHRFGHGPNKTLADSWQKTLSYKIKNNVYIVLGIQDVWKRVPLQNQLIHYQSMASLMFSASQIRTRLLTRFWQFS